MNADLVGLADRMADEAGECHFRKQKYVGCRRDEYEHTAGLLEEAAAELRALGGGVPVLWWNGVTQDGAATGPSVTGKRNQWHDVPLYAHPVGVEDGARTTRIDLSVFDQPGDPRSNLIAKGWTPPGSGRGGVNNSTNEEKV